jgi:hypothetical protein
MARDAVIEKILRHMQGNIVIFTEKEEEYRARLMRTLEIRLENLYLTDYRIFEIMRKLYPTISFGSVCNDITIVERMIAQDKDPSGDPHKVWTRYFIGEVTKEAIRIAREKDDPYTMAYSANILGKHRLTDKEDNARPPYDEIIPFVPELSLDPTIIGLKPNPNIDALREKLRAKFNLEHMNFAKTIVVRAEEPTPEFDEYNEDDED